MIGGQYYRERGIEIEYTGDRGFGGTMRVILNRSAGVKWIKITDFENVACKQG